MLGVDDSHMRCKVARELGAILFCRKKRMYFFYTLTDTFKKIQDGCKNINAYRNFLQLVRHFLDIQLYHTY